MFDFTLVMSASVDVCGMPGISHESVVNREQQYVETLRFYSRQTCVPHILFVDNSNWDLTRIERQVGHSEKISYLSLNENTYPREWGKGYGEFLLMDRAVDKLVKDNGGRGGIVKVTGRFPIINIATMVKEFSERKNLQLAVDVIDHPLYDWLRLGWAGHGCRTIIYACTFDFYMRYLHGRYVEIHGSAGGMWGAETLMRDVWEKTRHRPGVYSRFRHEPCLAGYAGAVNHAWITANNYSGCLSKLKRGIRQACRYMLPGLWL